MRAASGGNAVFLHRFQQCRLRLGRGAVDFVGQHHVGEYRSALEFERFAPGLVLPDDVRADDVARHQIGGELDARELQVQNVRHGLHQLGLAYSGNAFQQHVAPREQAGHHPGNDFFVADDHTRYFISDQLELLAEGLDLPICRSRCSFFLAFVQVQEIILDDAFLPQRHPIMG